MEREGYFAFARGGWRIVERIVTEFSEDDVNALGDNIVTILNTVKQPDPTARSWRMTNQRPGGRCRRPPIADGPIDVGAAQRSF